MQITRKSRFSGVEHTMELDVTPEQLAQWQSGMLIQRAMPHLTPDQREFLMTGVTAEEWTVAFGSEEDTDE